jgi:hypothetical protein
METLKPSILEMVLAGLANGRLWLLEGGVIWAGRGVLKPCIVCQLRIRDDQMQYDILGLGRSVPVHADCHHVWRAETDRRRVKPKRRETRGR